MRDVHQRKAGRRPLTDAERTAGRRWTPDGLLCGTPRTREDDPRFDRSYVPADVFSPHTEAVWAVLDRLTWFRFTDAERLLAAGRRLPAPAEDLGPDFAYKVVAAARAAGGHRYADWQALGEVVRNIKEATLPPEAGRGPGRYSKATATWDDAFGLARNIAEAQLVSDRPEVSADAVAWLTSVWRAAGQTAHPELFEAGTLAEVALGSAAEPAGQAEERPA